jgi:membrane protease YdiL (CAAX protease family)
MLTVKVNKEYPAFWAAILLFVVWSVTDSVIRFALTAYPRTKIDVQVIAIVASSLAFVTAIGFAQKKTNRSFAQIVGKLSIPLLPTIGIVLACIGLVGFLEDIDQPLREGLHMIGVPQGASQNFGNRIALTNSIVRLCVIAPIGEELLFRRIVLPGFLKNYGRIGGLLLSAFLFAFLHMDVLRFLWTLPLGVLLGIAYMRTESVLPAIIGHATLNGIGMYSGEIWTHFKSAGSQGWAVVVALTLLGLGVILIIFTTKHKTKSH